jgi:cell division initiation protein
MIMDNSRTFKNYTPEQIDQFLDQIIKQVERMIEDNKSKNREIALKDKKIEELSKMVANISHMQEKLAQYERMEATLNRAVVMAQRTSDQIKSTAHRESEIIIEDAKRNASRIVNESLLKAEKTEMEAEMLKRNITIFKRKLRNIIETQLELVDDIEKVEL